MSVNAILLKAVNFGCLSVINSYCTYRVDIMNKINNNQTTIVQVVKGFLEKTESKLNIFTKYKPSFNYSYTAV